MNRYKFISLDNQRQLRFLKVNGRMVHRRLKREYTVSIYQLENFYIEIWKNGLNKVVNLVTFKDRTLLNYQFNITSNEDLNAA